MRTLRLFGGGHADDARAYALDGSARVGEALEREGDPDVVVELLAAERIAWDRYYDAIDALEAGDPELRQRARTILADCRVASV